jgi:hypothetical protein
MTTSGPIHFYSSFERPAGIAAVVEYCVQIGENQPINRTQAAYLVGRGDVSLDGEKMQDVALIMKNGTWILNIRGKNHHVVVHTALLE